jgi:glycosyltransferase involved in cell wall biosynthesis
VTVIPNACDIDLFDVPEQDGRHIRDRLGISPDAALVVYTGAFGLVNGVGYLVELAAHEAAQHITFLLVGSGSEQGRIFELAQTRHVLGRNLHIWAPMPKDEMPGVFAAATLTTSLVIPHQSLWDNSANKFFESLAAGRPIAINYGGWQAELLEKSGAGIVLPPDDPEAAAPLLARHITDRVWLENARRAARQMAREQFDRDDLASQLEAVLRNAAVMGRK